MIGRGLFGATVAMAALVSGSANAGPCTRHLVDAALVSGVVADRLRKVMMAESAGQPKAVSSAGAMGCMQLMPGTWQELTARYGLGRDPFDARANMLGGALYLAEMIGRYGWPRALAAYHAGPGRLDQLLHAGRPLPASTIAYVSELAERASLDATSTVPAEAARDWRGADIFVSVRLEATNAQSANRNDASSTDQQ